MENLKLELPNIEFGSELASVIIELEHLRKEYPDIVPIKDVTAQIHQGDVISLIGPSGTGKSTLLRCINMLEKPTSGRIWLDDMEITDPACDIGQVRRRMGMVFQKREQL